MSCSNPGMMDKLFENRQFSWKMSHESAKLLDRSDREGVVGEPFRREEWQNLPWLALLGAFSAPPASLVRHRLVSFPFCCSIKLSRQAYCRNLFSLANRLDSFGQHYTPEIRDVVSSLWR